MNWIIILALAVIFITTIIIYIYFNSLEKRLKTIINKEETYKNDDDLLMIRYNYVINLKKIDSFTKELLNSKIDKKLLEYIKDYIAKINNYIYDNDTYQKTINFENEMLYNNEIINLDVVFYAYNHLFNILDNNYLKILNDQTKLKKEVSKKNKSFRKNLRNYRNKSIRILKEKDNNEKYYLKVEEMKNSYKLFIDKLNPILTILFIKYGINTISGNNEEN